ncbi:hypothetical protein [Pajaroellobacter abortibovis]|uniref:TonB-dependent receptor-like beta-barrel domain-containing protein n=1 Tax=Pajaroellobacter abortibovis TaxID=1882918 RepID=A0A1L6MYX0_9BACT|nr:hypothetical protein [Pajaroellobacter abortibovis]APS00706.1 hypothetical protein BCY86_08460 [Pajaroellobacter abortibovis]
MDDARPRKGIYLPFPPSLAQDNVLAAGGTSSRRHPVAHPLTIDMRLDGMLEEYRTDPWKGAKPPPRAHRSSMGREIDTLWQATSRLTIDMTNRTDVWQDRSENLSTLPSPSIRYTGHLGTRRHIKKGYTLLIRGGKLSRSPSFLELFGNRSAALEDPVLHSESTWTTEWGFTWLQSFASTKVRTELIGFSTQADDPITYLYRGVADRSKATNVDRSQPVGFEGGFTFHRGPLQGRIPYSWLNK